MALALPDCKVGTIVDQTTEIHEDGRETSRNPIRRGIIVKVVGDNAIAGSVSAVYVKFRQDAEPEQIKAAELSRVFQAEHTVAREAYRRIVGAPKHVGAEFAPKQSTRKRIEDKLILTPKRESALVKPAYDDDGVAGMDLPEES